MSQFPPSAPHSITYPPQPKQANAPAIISLVSGILSCVPLVSVVAVITGIIGLSKAKNPAVGGKGLAIAGLILGLIGVIWTIAAGGLFIAGRHAIKAAMNSPAHAVAKQFVTDVSSGNTDAVMADCDPSIDAAKVTAAVADAKSWGALTDSTLFVTPAGTVNNSEQRSLVAGVATYANTKKTVAITVSNPATTPKVIDFTFSDQNGTTINLPTTMTTAP